MAHGAEPLVLARLVRVAVVIDTLTWGGAEMLLTDLAGVAPAAGVELSVTYLRDMDGSPAADPLRRAGVDPVLVPMTRLHDPRGLLRVRRHLAALRPDVVHTHLGYADLLAGTAARSLGIPAVSTQHVMVWDGEGREGAKNRLMSFARRHAARRIVAVSEAGRAAYLAQGWDRPQRVVTVHNGVARTPVPGAGPGVRAELGLGPDDVVAAMVTVLREGKGHEVAAEAVAALRSSHPRLRLLVLGEGPHRADIERVLAPLGDAVVFGGHRDDVMRVLDAVDVLLHPTRWDAFPTALLEAMAAGVPVVATAVGGIPEIVDDGVTGLLVPAPPTGPDVTTALAALHDDAGRRRAMGDAGRARFAERFAVGAWARRLRALYDEVLAG
jgi:glycosyltransferase involved in cell wall biosynthesis